MHRFAVAIASALLAAGCAPSAPSPEPAAIKPVPRASAPAPRGDADAPLMPIAGDAATPSTTGDATFTASGRWFLQESDPPRAAWGVPRSEGQLLIGCDRAGAQLVLERQAIGVAEDVRVVVIAADDVRMDYPAERVDAALAPMLVTRIALDAPLLDRLLIAGRMQVTAGSDTITTTAPGDALRAVVDACRRAQPPA